MSLPTSITRRSLLGWTAAAASILPGTALAKKSIPIGLELYVLRQEMAKDLMGTVRAAAKLGYEIVEFYSPYTQWTVEYAKEVRKLLDELKIKCLSTHNGADALSAEKLAKTIELNQIIGSKTIVMASAGKVNGIDGWKGVAETLSKAQEKLTPLGMRAGFHNHKSEFVAIEGKRPMDVLAANTPKEVTLQLDVGTCVEAGQDPVAWIKANPGRIRCIHLKDWAAGEAKDEKGYRVLLGEGQSPWKQIFAAAEDKGGVEFYLVEQEGSRYTPLETAERCLAAYRKMRS